MDKIFKSIFVASFLDQTRTLRELLEESSDRADFYVLLTLATFISTLGLLIDNTIVILGGMLIAPILFPILGISMGVVTASPLAFLRSVKILIRSMIWVLIVSFLTSFVLAGPVVSQNAIFLMTPSLILFLIALTSGIAVSFSWVKRDLSAALPGVAVAVSLLTPLAAMGVGLASWQTNLIASATALFLVNLLATILGSIIIFALFGFTKLQQEEEQKIIEEVLEKKVHDEAVEEAVSISAQKI